LESRTLIRLDQSLSPFGLLSRSQRFEADIQFDLRPHKIILQIHTAQPQTAVRRLKRFA
jgi:hypothetical protein